MKGTELQLAGGASVSQAVGGTDRPAGLACVLYPNNIQSLRPIGNDIAGIPDVRQATDSLVITSEGA